MAASVLCLNIWSILVRNAPFNPSYIGGGAHFARPPPNGFLFFSRKFFPATYDETLCKFLLYTYEDSHNSFWSKILSREHVEYVKVAWAENVNFKDCNFRVLRGIFLGVSIKQKLLKIEKYQGRWPFFLDLSIFRVKKLQKRIFRVLREIFQGVCFYAN